VARLRQLGELRRRDHAPDSTHAGRVESPCIDPIFGPTKAFRYWASNPAQRTSRGSVDFFAGGPQIDFQLNQFHARAVRLGP